MQYTYFCLEFKKTENKVNCCLANNVIKTSNGGPGEMAQLVKSTCALEFSSENPPCASYKGL